MPVFHLKNLTVSLERNEVGADVQGLRGFSPCTTRTDCFTPTLRISATQRDEALALLREAEHALQSLEISDEDDEPGEGGADPDPPAGDDDGA